MIKARIPTGHGILSAYGATEDEARALLVVGTGLYAQLHAGQSADPQAATLETVPAAYPGQVYLGDALLLDPRQEDPLDLTRIKQILGRADRIKTLLSRAAGRLQDYAGEVNGDMNDALAMEIEDFLATLP